MPEPYEPEIIIEEPIIIGAYLERNVNCESRVCTSSYCGEWGPDPSCVPVVHEVPIEIYIEVPEDTNVIEIDTGIVTEPTVIEVKSDPSDPASPSTVVVDVAGLPDTEV